MYADRVFEFGVVLATSTAVGCAAPENPHQDQGWTFARRSVISMEPCR
jgi:hypothetical protein